MGALRDLATLSPSLSVLLDPAYTLGAMRLDPLPQKVYAEYNARYFGGRLPTVPVVWSRKYTQDCEGCFIDKPYPVIYLNPKFKKWERVWEMVLLHEQVHVEQMDGSRLKDHGRKFQNRMKKLARQNAFQDLW